MSSISAVIVPAKVLADGRHKIRVAIAHNGKTRYIPTSIVVDSEKEFKNGCVVKRPDAAYLNTKLREILQNYQESIDAVPYPDGMTCSELIAAIKSQSRKKTMTIGSVFDEYIECAQISDGTRTYYKAMCRALTKCISKDTPLEHIDCPMILSIVRKLNAKVKDSTVRDVIATLNTMLRYAQKCGYVQYVVNPISVYKRPRIRPRDSWLSVEEVRRVRDYNAPKAKIAKAIDFFMLSYYLGGMNIVDLMSINFNECKNSVTYVRAKIKSRNDDTVTIPILPEAREIIKRIVGADGHIKGSCSQNKERFCHFFRHQFKIIGKALDIPQIVYYSARKSFSQHALELGVPTQVIDYILGHVPTASGGSSIRYYVYVTPEMAAEALKKVVSHGSFI